MKVDLSQFDLEVRRMLKGEIPFDKGYLLELIPDIEADDIRIEMQIGGIWVEVLSYEEDGDDDNGK